MRIGVLSDTHNNLYILEQALGQFRQRGVRTLLHCGDITAPVIVRAMADFEVWFVEGNMDDRVQELSAAVEETQGAGHLRVTHSLHLGERRVAACHGNDVATFNAAVKSGLYDYVFYGHIHRPDDRQVGQTRVINPGALGQNGFRPPSCCVVDLRTGNVEWLEF